MPIKKGYMLKQVGNDYMIIPIDNNNVSMNKVFNLNPSAAKIYQELEQGYLPEDIAYRLAQQFRIREDILLKDVNEFIDELRKRGIYE